MIFDDYIKLLAPTIGGKRHKWYKRTVALAKLYKILITQEGINTLMRKFARREDDTMFAQRVELTQHITKPVADNIIDTFNEIHRSPSIKRIMKYENNKSKNVEAMQTAVDKFWGVDTLNKYISTRWVELNFLDPNTFVVIEWGKFDHRQEHARPYPFEASSEEAVNYEYQNKILQWLIVKTKVKRKVIVGRELKEKEIIVYTLYLPDHTVKFTQILDDRIIDKVGRVLEKTKIAGNEYVRIKQRDRWVWLIEEPDAHDLGYVPAFRVGYKRDHVTDGHTFVNPFDAAVPYFMKMIKTVSEMDLTMCLHAFSQKFQYVPKCSVPNCRNGEVTDSKGAIAKCTTCKGSGFAVHTTAQDIISFGIPKDPKNVMDMSKMVFYGTPEVELLKFQKVYIDWLDAQVKITVFNADMFTRSEISQTATERTLDEQNKNNTLYPMAVAMNTDWENYTWTVARITDLDEGLVVSATARMDLKLKGLDDLYRELEKVSKSNADTFIKMEIQDDIATIIYADDPIQMQRYRVMRKFFPFSGKTKEQIMLTMSGNTVTLFDKVLYDNYGNIFDRLEMENKNFFLLPIDKQWELIEARVNEIIEAIGDNRPELVIPEKDEE